MATHRNSARPAALLATALAVTLTAAVTPSAQATAGPARTARALEWRPCTGGPAGQECADLPVPLDYARPDGPALTLAVSRLRTDRPGARRGTLMVIPGGPGSSGVQRLTQKGAALREATEGRYDLVSLDPRGVGGSTKAGCGLAEDDRMLTALRSWPAADGSIDENLARSRRTAEACARNGGEVLRSFTSANQVRDLDRFRQALGERKVSAWGVSYGTYIGAQYAQAHPGRVDRLVLDSSGDPDPARVERGWLANMARGAADRFPDFAAWASDPAREADGLRLAERPEDVGPLLLDLAARLDRTPGESSVPGAPLTGNGLRQTLQNALYSDSAFAGFAALVRSVEDPAAVPVLPPELVHPLPDQDAALMVSVICNDVRWPADTGAYREEVAADRERYPLTAGMPANITPCSFWQNPPADEPATLTDDGPSNVLMIQSLRDPATPYSGALKMRAALGAKARLVTVEHGGHGMYLGNGNACGDRTVNTFLTTGRRPARDTYCAD
ncbi:alpha/beta hydrolase [Streptomyces sp. NPDC060184]|uniref:alpha/beta hydrolase n=1 Tax=Streptomyces sp. NPDC060184 TaxID=3347064 RepID=UPI00365DFFF1